jgi:hypothetical protein
MVAWLWHPLNLTAVLYVVQRMTSLASLWVLLGLIGYLLGRQRLNSGQRLGGWGLLLFGLGAMTPLAWFSKENGILLPGFAMLLEVFILRFQTPRRLDRRLLVALFGLLVVLPVLVGLAYWATHPHWPNYSNRLFSLPERLLTQTRVIWYYLYLMLPWTFMELGLYHDDFSLSTALLSPPDTLFALLGLAGLVLLLPWLWRVRPLLGLGVAIFLLGHSLESSIIPLEMVYEHRNYLPLWGVLLAGVSLLGLTPDSRRQRLALVALLSFVLSAWALATHYRAQQWASEASLLEWHLLNHPQSLRANYQAGKFFYEAQQRYQREGNAQQERYFHELVRELFLKSASLSPNDVMGLIGLMATDDLHGRPLDSAHFAQLLQRLANQPLQSATDLAVLSLARCQAMGACTIGYGRILQVIEAFQRNTGVSAARQRVMQRPERIIRGLERVARAPDPLPALIDLLRRSPGEPYFRFMLADALRQQGRFAEARRLLTPLWPLQGRDGWLTRPLQVIRVRLQNRDRTALNAVGKGFSGSACSACQVE